MGIHPASGHAALRRHRHSRPQHVYHITSASAERMPVFVSPGAFAAARCFGTDAFWGDATVLAWVLMPDHAHWLVQLGDLDALHIVVNRIKSASARCVRALQPAHPAIWQRGYYEQRIATEAGMLRTARYIVANPIRAGLVTSIGDYPFWNTAFPP